MHPLFTSLLRPFKHDPCGMPVRLSFTKFSRLPISQALGAIFLIVAMLGAVAIFSLSSHIKRHSISQLATAEAQRASELIFQNVYAAMKRGASGKELENILANIATTIPEIEIRLLRSSKVAELFGDAQAARNAREQDPLVREVFATANQQLIDEGENLRFVYPVLVKDECVACHVNTLPNDVNGVIDIRFPVNELRVPLEFTITSVSYLFIGVAIILFLLTYFSVRYFLVRPISDMAGHMRSVGESHDLSDRLEMGRAAFREITDLGKLFNGLLDKLEGVQRHLRERSERDPLTGLLNRRRFEELARDELVRSERYGRSCCVLVVDLNGFKPVNDTWGHDAGDELLVRIAQELHTKLRAHDVIARMGGDEFLVLMPETGSEQATVAVSRLRDAICSAEIARDRQRISAGAAVGVAIYPKDGTSVETLIKVADAAMYEDKEGGRQRVKLVRSA